MKLYKLFSIGLVTLTALLISALAVQAANSANKRAFVVPAHCNTIRAFYIGHTLNLLPSGNDDDASGFIIRTSFLPHDINFPASNLSFDLLYPDGTPLNDFVIIDCEADQGNLEFFSHSLKFNNSSHWFFDFTQASITNPDFIGVMVNDIDDNGNYNVLVTNVHLNGNFNPSGDLTHVDPAFACD